MTDIIMELETRKERAQMVALSYAKAGYVEGANRMYNGVELLQTVINELKEGQRNGII